MPNSYFSQLHADFILAARDENWEAVIELIGRKGEALFGKKGEEPIGWDFESTLLRANRVKALDALSLMLEGILDQETFVVMVILLKDVLSDAFLKNPDFAAVCSPELQSRFSPPAHEVFRMSLFLPEPLPLTRSTAILPKGVESFF